MVAPRGGLRIRPLRGAPAPGPAPRRRSSRRGPSTVLGAILLAVLVLVPTDGVLPAPAGGAPTTPRDPAQERRAALPAPADPDHPGALAHLGGFRYTGRPDARIVPAVAGPPDFVPVPTGGDCRVPTPGSVLVVCTRATPRPPRGRIVVVGDSHAQQYAGALEAIADDHDWQIVTMLRGSCPFSTASESIPGSPGCIAWNAAARAEIRASKPDLVVTTASRDVRPGLTETTPAGFVRAWKELAAADIPVLAIRDNPRFRASPADCVRRNGPTSQRCTTPRAAVLDPVPPYRRLAGVPSTVSFFDPSDHVCTATTCPPVVGNVLVYFDENHLSATFTRSLGPVLAPLVIPLMSRGPA